MAKKRERSKYTSKGERQSVSQKTLNAMRADRASDRVMDQLKAFRKNKRVMVTIPNPDKSNTKERFIKVPGEAYFLPENKDGMKSFLEAKIRYLVRQ